MKKNETVNRVCIVETVYALMLYLLYCSEEEIKNTFYFTGDTLSSLLKGKGINNCSFKAHASIFQRILFRIKLYWFSHWRWSFLKTAQIYGQDHIQWFSGLIGSRNYTLIEDGPKNFSYYFNNSAVYREAKKGRNGLGKIRLKLCYGPTYAWSHAENNQCENIILTEKTDLEYLNGKTSTLVSIDDLWEKSSETKKQLILNIFNIDSLQNFLLESCGIIILTQPFYIDVPDFSEQEQIDLFSEIINRYHKKDIIIKVHPRDKINYQKYFPDVKVLELPIPMQLLNLAGIRFQKVVTVCSSSVMSFPYKIDIEWVGVTCRKKLLDFYGSDVYQYNQNQS